MAGARPPARIHLPGPLRAAACGLRAAAVAAVLAVPAAAWAQSVALGGIVGNKALLVLDRDPPRWLAAGESHRQVKVIAVERDAAVVEIDGQRQTLRLGDQPVSVGARGSAPARRLVLAGDSRGHFFAQGRVNGHLMQFMVDTGASTVAFSAAEAQRMGLDYQAGQPVRMGTANGVVQGWRLRLPLLRVGDVEERDVEAVVVPYPMPYALLGNSFLARFQMTRADDRMVLERR